MSDVSQSPQVAPTWSGTCGRRRRGCTDPMSGAGLTLPEAMQRERASGEDPPLATVMERRCLDPQPNDCHEGWVIVRRDSRDDESTSRATRDQKLALPARRPGSFVFFAGQKRQLGCQRGQLLRLPLEVAGLAPWVVSKM